MVRTNFANTSIHAEDDSLDTSFELMDKGDVLPAKMKIALSLIPGYNDNIEDFMKRVDHDVSHMSSLHSGMSTLRLVLKTTKAIMDRLSQVIFQV
jgi:hypothetical protein